MNQIIYALNYLEVNIELTDGNKGPPESKQKKERIQ